MCSLYLSVPVVRCNTRPDKPKRCWQAILQRACSGSDAVRKTRTPSVAREAVTHNYIDLHVVAKPFQQLMRAENSVLSYVDSSNSNEPVQEAQDRWSLLCQPCRSQPGRCQQYRHLAALRLCCIFLLRSQVFAASTSTVPHQQPRIPRRSTVNGDRTAWHST